MLVGEINEKNKVIKTSDNSNNYSGSTNCRLCHIFTSLLKANAPQRELYAQEKIRFIAYGEDLGSYNLEELLALEGVEEKTFKDIYDTSANPNS